MLRNIFSIVVLSSTLMISVYSEPLISNINGDEKDNDKDKTTSPFSLNAGVDVVSRYIWRGVEFGVDQNGNSTPHLQPTAGLTYTFTNNSSLSFGIWGSYGFSGNYSESDLYLNVFVPTEHIDFSLTFNDYYYPYLKIPFTNFENYGAGANTIDAQLLLSLKSYLPVSFLISSNIYNDFPDNNSLYLECQYSFDLSNINFELFAGAAKGYSVWHSVSTDKFEFVNVGFKASRSIKVSDEFSIPVETQWIYNHHLKQNYVVFKVTI